MSGASSTYLVAAVVVLLLACTFDTSKHDHDEFREDVVLCEEAVSYLTSCCDRFDAHAIACRYHYDSTESGCSTSIDAESPALSLDESRCIVGRSCAALRANGICARAQTASPYTSQTHPNSADAARSSHAPVCP